MGKKAEFFVKIEPMKADEKPFTKEAAEGEPFELHSSLYNTGFTVTIYGKRKTGGRENKKDE